jgi:Flp pilus assembly protein TadG
VSHRFLHEERGLIGSSFVKVAIFLLVLFVAGVETATVVFSRVQTQDTSEQAAREAAVNFRDHGDVQAARAAAENVMLTKDPEAQLRQFEVRSDGSVRVVVFRRARTWFIHRIGFLKEFTESRGRAVAPPPLR